MFTNYKKLFSVLFVSLLLFSATSVLAADNLDTPIGVWTQIDESTNKPRSIIEIYADKNDAETLSGKILQAFPHDGKPPRTYCDLCQGDLYNAPIIGLVIMHNFKQKNEKTWDDGTILDPSSGKIYSCKLTLVDHGKEMRVRGYVGMALFGRTQVWQRRD